MGVTGVGLKAKLFRQVRSQIQFGKEREGMHQRGIRFLLRHAAVYGG